MPRQWNLPQDLNLVILRKITYELSALDFYVLLENGFNNSSHWVPLRSKLFNQHKEIRKHLRIAED